MQFKYIKNESTDQITIKKEVEIEQPMIFDEESIFPDIKDSFANITIKKEVLDELSSPLKSDIYENSDSNSKNSFKSSKSKGKTRDSPYKKFESPYKAQMGIILEKLEQPSTSHVTVLNFDSNNKRKKEEK